MTLKKYSKNKNIQKKNKTNTKNGRKKTIKRNKKGGNKNGPYYSIDNIFLPSYSRYGASGTSKLWKGGIYLK